MDAAEGAPWLEAVPEDQRRTTSLLIQPDGRNTHGAESLEAIGELVPAFRPLAQAVARLGVERQVDALEGAVSRNRAKLGKLVPNVPPVRRFP